MVSPFVVVGTLVSAPSYGELACDRGRAVAVDSAGRIAGVGDADAASLARLCDLVGCDSAEGVLVLPDGHALCPGFIDIHIHAPQFSYTGTATDKPLMDWLEHYTFPSEARLGADLHEAREVYAGVVHQTLRQGTTTAMYFATVHQEPCTVLLEVLDQLGQRALVGKASCSASTVIKRSTWTHLPLHHHHHRRHHPPDTRTLPSCRCVRTATPATECWRQQRDPCTPRRRSFSTFDAWREGKRGDCTPSSPPVSSPPAPHPSSQAWGSWRQSTTCMCSRTSLRAKTRLRLWRRCILGSATRKFLPPRGC
mmetsp:Transcript_5248/g.13544  ORF Transcript_5248/g.13544 Transcript_5248/m.13544 type:complete len:309 (+) Transcript_5248:163-1089(+)